MKSDAKTVPAYLKTLPADRKRALTSLRKLIKDTVPELIESMRFGMPTYDMPEGQFAGPRGTSDFCAFASQKQYMALYVMNEPMINKLKAQMPKTNIGKCCIRFRKAENLPLDVVKNLLELSAADRHEDG